MGHPMQKEIPSLRRTPEKSWPRCFARSSGAGSKGIGGFVHFGYDYYMYVGVETPCPQAQRLAAQLGLFVEEMRSPYHPESE